MTVERVIAEQQKQIAERDALLAERDAMLADERKKVAQLQQDLALLKREIERLLRGGRRNDKLAPGQGVLFPVDPLPETSEDPTPEHANEAPDGETPADPIRRRCQPATPARKIDTSALARRDEVHEVPETERVCPTTGLPLVELGEKVFEEIHFERAKLSVVVHRRKIYGLAPAVAAERKAEALIAPMPTRPLDDCAASAALLAWILVQKYCNHLPLHRQEAIFQREGLRLPRQTTCDWVLGAAELLTPIVDHLFNRIRGGPVAQLDDTPVKCQGGKGQGMFRAYLWSFTSPGVEGVVFRFKTGRGADQIVDELVGIKGYLVGDGLSTNKSAAIKAGDKVVLVG
jgi:transposase